MAVQLDQAKVTLSILSRLKNPLDKSTPEDVLEYLKSLEFADGAGDDQGNLHWHDSRSLNATTGETLDLTALAGGAFGAAAFADVRALLIVNESNVGNLEVGAAAATVWSPFVKDPSDIVLVPKSGIFLWLAPKDAGGAVSGSAKSLKIHNAGGQSQTYLIFILGNA